MNWDFEFQAACVENNKTKAALLLEEEHALEYVDHTNALVSLCINGQDDMVEWLTNTLPTREHDLQISYAFVLACNYGHLSTAKIVNQAAKRANHEIDYERAFHNAALVGHLDVVKWLTELGNFGDANEWERILSKIKFKFVCVLVENNHLEVLNYIIDLYVKLKTDF